MRKDIKALVESSKYDLLMKQKGVVSSSEFYVNRKGDKVRELIMIIDGAASLKYVYLEGEMTLKDIQSIMKYQSSGLINGEHSIYSIPNVNINLADNGFLESIEGLNNLDNLKGLESLKDMMNSDKWKKFGEEMKNTFEKEFNVKDWE